MRLSICTLPLFFLACSAVESVTAGGMVRCDTTATSGSCVEGEVDTAADKQAVRSICEVAQGDFGDVSCGRTDIVAGCKYPTEYGERRTWYYPKATITGKEWTMELIRQDCANKPNSTVIDPSGNPI